MSGGPRLLYPLVFVAGAATMSTEMSASRLLAPFFGASILVWANIIGLILLYLSVGYFWGGKLADRHPQITYLARLMLIAAACIAATPFITKPLLDRAVSAFADASVGAFLGSFFASMLIFSVSPGSSRPERSPAACTRSRRQAASWARSCRWRF